MKKTIVLIIFIFLILGSLSYFILNYSFIGKIVKIEERLGNVESSLIRLEKGQKEILKKIVEVQSSLIDLEKQLGEVKDQNKHTQYLVERNGLDMKFIAKVITDMQYYEELLKLKKKYMTEEKKDKQTPLL